MERKKSSLLVATRPFNGRGDRSHEQDGRRNRPSYMPTSTATAWSALGTAKA